MFLDIESLVSGRMRRNVKDIESVSYNISIMIFVFIQFQLLLKIV